MSESRPIFEKALIAPILLIVALQMGATFFWDFLCRGSIEIDRVSTRWGGSLRELGMEPVFVRDLGLVGNRSEVGKAVEEGFHSLDLGRIFVSWFYGICSSEIWSS